MNKKYFNLTRTQTKNDFERFWETRFETNDFLPFHVEEPLSLNIAATKMIKVDAEI